LSQEKRRLSVKIKGEWVIVAEWYIPAEFPISFYYGYNNGILYINGSSPIICDDFKGERIDGES